MKKFIIRLAIFSALVVAVDFTYGRVMLGMRNACQEGFVKSEILVADSITADVLIFGSSRARMQYVPDIIEDSLNLTCFNCGHNGMGAIYHYGMISMVLERYTPQLVIYDVLPVLEIGTRDDNVIFLNQLRSFYGCNSTIDSIFSDYDQTEPLKMLAQTYRYHGKFLELLACCSEKDSPKKGFTIYEQTMKHPVSVDMALHYDVDSFKLKYLEKFIAYTSSKTKMVICASPRYGYTECGDAFDAIAAICKKYDVPFINHYTDEEYVHDLTLFKDATHFNYKGACKWSSEIGSEILKLRLNNNEGITL